MYNYYYSLKINRMSASPDTKYIITPDKFFLDGKNRLMFTITNEYGVDISLNQHLPLIGRHYLKVIARIVDIYVGRKWSKTLLTELTDKIDFQIPENLLAYKHEPILDKYINFQQIYIPLSKQTVMTFYYELNNLSFREQVSSRYETNSNVAKVWFTYPFNKKTPKRKMVLLCDEIKIMSKGDAAKCAKCELIELLNEKFVLEERAG